MQFVSILLILLILFTAFGTFASSLQSRRAPKGTREAIRSRMNMYMGAMFLGIATLQLINLYQSTLQIVVAIFIALLGILNLYAGFRNYQTFRKYL